VAIIKRREPYPSFTHYQDYKPRLREDFTYFCAYCSIHEREWGGLRQFHVEHFRPKSLFPELKTDYDNLLYACSVCNIFKSNDWPSDHPLEDGVGYLDPCEQDYAEHFRNDPEAGEVEGTTAPARYMVERLHLNRQYLIKLRHKRATEEDIHARFAALCEDALGRIERSLEDEALPEHVVATLGLARGVIEALWAERQRWWERRWDPPYGVDDLR
jgi:uncharacterized protein (TIGR02646 family)